MIKMSLSDLARELQWSTPTHDTQFSGISHDTRTIQNNNLYVAINGEQFDGHQFINEAQKKGASAALISKKLKTTLPQLKVKDTIAALGQISAYWRNQFTLPLVGVTGSNGKTTLKNMIASIFKAACKDNASEVLSTEGNLNNNIGMPLMLSRLSKHHRYAVIEMGMNHFGEIDYLTKIAKPQVAVINNAAESHLEGLKDVAGVARAKGEIFSGLQKNGTAILNQDDTYYDYWRSLVEGKHKIITFALHGMADITAKILQPQHIIITTPQGNIDVTLPLLGKHNIKNALAAAASTLAVNIDLASIKQGLETTFPAPGRMHPYLLPNSARIVDDTYNANPFSLQAAITTLAEFSGVKVLVLGDMKELGDNAEQLHLAAGEKIRSAGIEHLFTLGELTTHTAKGFGKNAYHFTDHDKLLHALKPFLKKGVNILVKGSRSMKMEIIIEQIVPKELLKSLH